MKDVKKEIKQEKIDEFAKMIFAKGVGGGPHPMKYTKPFPFSSTSTVPESPAPPNSGQKKKPVNDDWINFLKKKQDVEPKNDDIDVLKVERPPPPAAVPNKKVKPVVLEKAKPVVMEKAKPVASVPVQQMINKEMLEGNGEKDRILKNLLNQVSDLETTMGSSISKLEVQLKAEQEKSLKLKIRLDDEKEINADLRTSKTAAEEALKAANGELKEEKSVNIELFDKTINLEEGGKEDKKLLEKTTAELRNAASVNKVLSKNVDNLTKWKSDCSARIEATKAVCSKEHGERIQELEDRAETLEMLLRDLTVKMPVVIEGFKTELAAKVSTSFNSL